jgi:OFA family oxalate/formate antiporter-like MFS transporter
MKKYFTLIASVIIMICMGGVYAWSIFVEPLKKGYGLNTAQTQIIFGLTIMMFTWAMIIAGRMEKRYNNRIIVLIGMSLFVSGYIIASFSKGSFPLILLGIGILSGIGIGFNYLSAIVSPVKWFPNREGFITGLTVAGFGSGAILLSNIVETLLKNGMDVLDIFRTIGLIYGLAIMLSLFFLYSPNTGENEEFSKISIRDLIKGKYLWSLFLGMFAGTFAGLIVVGNLKPIGLYAGVSRTRTTIAISLLALGNMSGRILWGYISDRLNGEISINSALSLLSASTMGLLLANKSNDIIFLLLSFIIGIGFGANFVLFAKEVSRSNGTNNFGLIYPYIFLSYGLAGVLGPFIGGVLYDITGTYSLSIVVSSFICATGILLYNYLRK